MALEKTPNVVLGNLWKRIPKKSREEYIKTMFSVTFVDGGYVERGENGWRVVQMGERGGASDAAQFMSEAAAGGKE